MLEVHGEGYACDHCEKRFAKKKLLNAHKSRISKTAKKGTKRIYDFKNANDEEVKTEQDLNNDSWEVDEDLIECFNEPPFKRFKSSSV